MPLLEAIPDETHALKYKLISLDNRNATSIPYVSFKTNEGSADETSLGSLDDDASSTVFNFSFTTEGIIDGEGEEGYKIILTDLRVGDVTSIALKTGANNIQTGNSITGRATKTLLINSSGRFKYTRVSSVPAADSPYRASIIIEGLRTGARVEIPIKISD